MHDNRFIGASSTYVWSAICLALIALSLAACRPSPRPPLEVSALRPIGVYSIGATPAGSVAGHVDPGKESLKGAAKGGGIGLASGVGGGALTGAGLGLACGPLAIVCSPVFALWGGAIGGAAGLVTGGTIGAVHRGLNTMPAESAGEARAAVAAVVDDRDLQAELRGRVVDVVGSDPSHAIDLGGYVRPIRASDYRALADRGIPTAMEVEITELSLNAEEGRNPDLALSVRGHARVVSIPDGRVLWTKEDLEYVSPGAPLPAWTSEEPSMLSSELDHALDALAHVITIRILPDTSVAAEAGAHADRLAVRR